MHVTDIPMTETGQVARWPADAIAYIQQLQADNAELRRKNEAMKTEVSVLASRLAAAEKKR